MTLSRQGVTLFRLTCAVLLLLIFGWLMRRSEKSEPTYAGKSLRAWLNAYCSAEYEGDQEDARQAIQRIGTNAIPCLVEMLIERDPRLMTALDSFLRRYHFQIPLRTARQHNSLAEAGFRALRSTARSATPELIRLLGNQDIGVRVGALRSLGFIQPVGPEAALSVTRCLNDSNLVVRLYAAEAMREIESGARPWWPKAKP